jgi:uncharacterized protein (DUF362 family)
MEWSFDLNRREFLWGMGTLSSMALLGGVSFALDTKPMSAHPKNVVVGAGWLPKGNTSYSLFKAVVEKATDFSWLGQGKSVLVKLALNSGVQYPMTSDPWALDCLLKVLKEHGAGKIYVGDQSGARNVFWNAQGQQRGSTKAFMQSTGLLPVIERNGATPVYFEERGYDSYIKGVPAGESHWKEPIRITNFVNEVDNIVYLPRLGSHVLADFTGALKIGIGFLREDSRRVFHSSGANYYPMYEEINEVPEIKSKLRLSVCTGRSVMSLMGPDMGYVLEPESAPVFASENLLAHDLFLYAYLQYARENLTPKDASDPAILKALPVPAKTLWDATPQRATLNRAFLKYTWKMTDEQTNQIPDLPVFQPGDIYKHPAIVNYIKLNQQQDLKFTVAEVNKNTDLNSKQYLNRTLKVSKVRV